MVSARLVTSCPSVLDSGRKTTCHCWPSAGREASESGGIPLEDVSASEYLEDGVNGCIVPSGDAEGLRQRIFELWQDGELCERIGEAGRQLAEEEYTGQRWRERMMKLALLLLHQKPPVLQGTGGEIRCRDSGQAVSSGC